MLENSDFNDGIKLKNTSNKNKFIKNSKIYYNKSIKRMKKILTKNKKIFLIFVFFICLLLFFYLKSQIQMKNEKISYTYDKPMLPFKKEDNIIKPFTNSYYNSSNIRYHFHDLFENRKIFKINYNFLIYTKINKKISFDENAKNISELYFFDIGDNYFAFTLDALAGKFKKNLIFSRNNFYPNAGICLTNVRKFREDNLYKNSFFASLAYKHLPCPSQDIFLMISNYKFKYLPLNYNCPQFFKDNEKNVKDNNSSMIYIWLLLQKDSQFRYSKEEMIKASINPVIVHLNANKPFYNLANSENTLAWINYAKMAGVYSKVKKKYPNILKRFNLD